MVPPLIALEEHYDSGLFATQDELHANLPPHLHDSLHDLENERIKALDNGKVSIQVISHIGCPTPVKECIAANDKLAAACKKNPKRLAAFACLPMQDPSAAADELSRAVKELNFVGALINNTADDGSFYDDEKFWPVFERAVELDVPVYIHPSYPVESSHYAGNFSTAAKVMMGASGWGWHSECGLHILRLFASGLFDRLPKLKVVIGHMGEMLPYMLDRTAKNASRWGHFERDLKTVWRENIWVTTSGLFTLPPLRCLLETTPMEHVMYSIDYPFSTNETGLAFVEEIERSGLLTGEQLKDFCYQNAQRLLKVSVS